MEENMTDKNRNGNFQFAPPPSSRRRAIAAMAVALGSLTAAYTMRGTAQQSVDEVPSTPANAHRTSLHQEVEFKATPQRIYEILLDSKQFATFTSMPAEIDPRAGGAFSMFGGLIVGRTIELVPNQRIVQAWRPAHWDAGVYSIVRFDLREKGSATTILLDHTGFPGTHYDSLYAGWKSRYWDPMRKYLG
jgi:activator of HSP90 ATPase